MQSYVVSYARPMVYDTSSIIIWYCYLAIVIDVFEYASAFFTTGYTLPSTVINSIFVFTRYLIHLLSPPDYYCLLWYKYVSQYLYLYHVASAEIGIHLHLSCEVLLFLWISCYILHSDRFLGRLHFNTNLKTLSTLFLYIKIRAYMQRACIIIEYTWDIYRIQFYLLPYKDALFCISSINLSNFNEKTKNDNLYYKLIN